MKVRLPPRRDPRHVRSSGGWTWAARASSSWSGSNVCSWRDPDQSRAWRRGHH